MRFSSPFTALWLIFCLLLLPLDSDLLCLDQSPLTLSQQKLDEVELAFIDPIWDGRSLSSDQGGIVKAPHIHFEAHSLCFTRSKSSEGKGHLIARGGIYANYFGSCFVGEELEFDFAKKTGVLRLARVQVGSWYIGGSEIHLLADGSYHLRHAWAATRTFPGIIWQGFAEQMIVHSDRLIDFRAMTLKIGNRPIANFRSLRTQAETLEHFPLALTFQIGSKNTRKLGIRYTKRAETYRSYLQLDRWWTGDWGAGVRVESRAGKSDWSTSHYFARDQKRRDALEQNRDRKWRFICNAKGVHHLFEGNARLTGQFSRSSDSHFSSRLGQSNHFKPHRSTYIAYRHQWPHCVFNVRALVKVNPYETRKQELPGLELFPSVRQRGKWHFEQSLESANLVLSYPQKSHQNQFSAWRTIWNGRLTRHQRIGHILTASATVGARGYAVSQQPGKGASQWITPRVESHLQMPIWASNRHLDTAFNLFVHHTLSPRLPRRSADSYVFDMQEAVTSENRIAWGVRGILNYRMCPILDYAIWLTDPVGSLGKPQPRRCLIDLTWRLTRRFECDLRSWFNRNERSIDRTAARLRATFSEKLAATVEYDKRNLKSWRGIGDDRDWLAKWHSQKDLLASDLSDRRHYLSSSVYWLVDPDLALKWQTRRGFGRAIRGGTERERGYSEWGLGAVAIVPGQWKMQFCYERRTGRRGLRRYLINLESTTQTMIVTKPSF